MTRDEVIAMAREAGLNAETDRVIGVSALERFAKLVAANEREACAQVCDDFAFKVNSRWIPRDCAAAIRARGVA